jgi:hypothetical protein
MPACLTVLAPIVPGREDALRATLAAIGQDVGSRRLGEAPARLHVHFTRCRLVHFARFAVLDDPDRGPGRFRLLFASNYDGSLTEHLGELQAATTDMDGLWGACEGYGGAMEFEAFVRRHALQPEAFYIAFPTAGAHGSRRSLHVRRLLEQHLDREGPSFLADATGATRAERWPGLYDELVAARPPRRAPWPRRIGRMLEAGVRMLLRHGPLALLIGLRRITASLRRVPLARLFNWLTANAMPPLASSWSRVVIDSASPCQPLEPGDDVASVHAAGRLPFREEDAVAQNQLTLVTSIRAGGRRQVEAVLALIDAYSKHLAAPGSLIGISTIHFVRWLVIDDGRRLMMLSDYDGSWEAYIDEFAEMILSGLDAIWGTALGYPPEGARDLAAFKRFLRCHQVPASVFYSGYPDSTVQNLVRDLPLADAVSEGLRERSTRGWAEQL